MPIFTAEQLAYGNVEAGNNLSEFVFTSTFPNVPKVLTLAQISACLYDAVEHGYIAPNVRGTLTACGLSESGKTAFCVGFCNGIDLPEYDYEQDCKTEQPFCMPWKQYPFAEYYVVGKMAYAMGEIFAKRVRNDVAVAFEE